MSISERIYSISIFKKFKKLDKINTFFRNFGSKARFASLIKKKSNNLDYKFTDYSFSPHNPLTNTDRTIKWICENYHAAFDHLDKKNYQTVLEIGCGFGVSTWIMNDIVDNKITGLDINQEAVDTAQYLFPECNFVCSDFKEFFIKNQNIKFDLIISCFGPIKIEDLKIIMEHCDEYIHIGYRARSLKNFLFWTHKRKGKHLSFSTTLIKKNNYKSKISLKYFKYYFTWFYWESIKHAISNRTFIPF
jgi:SAM-dependent methyltransferase